MTYNPKRHYPGKVASAKEIFSVTRSCDVRFGEERKVLTRVVPCRTLGACVNQIQCRKFRLKSVIGHDMTWEYPVDKNLKWTFLDAQIPNGFIN